jgi:hypothetical protein
VDKPHFNIIIATPGNNFTQGYVRSLLQTVSAISAEGLSWNFLNQSSSLVSMAREMTIAGPGVNDPSITEPFAGQFTYDKIIWIDSDIEWTVADFFKLYKSDYDIVSGCYLMQDRHTPIYEAYRGPMMSEDEILSRTEPFKVAGIGFGFVAMKSGVFENIPRPWFGPIGMPISEGSTEMQMLLIGEDLSWSTKAIQSGFEIWTDPSVHVVHNKSFNIFWKDQIEKMKNG